MYGPFDSCITTRLFLCGGKQIKLEHLSELLCPRRRCRRRRHRQCSFEYLCLISARRNLTLALSHAGCRNSGDVVVSSV